jgi:S1-C subfamily serine protease
MANLESDKLTLSGPNGDAILAVQETGAERIQLRWNADGALEYIVNGEPAFMIDMNVILDPYFRILRALPGIAGSPISFSEHFTINQAGNVGLGVSNAIEKLQIVGNMICGAVKCGAVNLHGPTSIGSLSCQDGTGRIQLRWNSTSGPNPLYINSNEPAFFMDINLVNEPYFRIQRAPEGIAGNPINFTTHLSIRKNGWIGMGVEIPQERLQIVGNMICGAVKCGSLLLYGPTTNGILSAEDGTGRMQMRWNSTSGVGSTYLISGEPSFFIDMNIINEPYFRIARAPPGISGNLIDWTNHVTITQGGNVGIGIDVATEKVDVDGNIKCCDLIFTKDDFKERLATDSQFIDLLCNTLEDDIYNIFERVRSACSTCYGTINGINFSGSGSFITLNPADLVNGLFLTAAHNVMEVSGGIVYLATRFFVTNPINNQWVSVDVTKIYYDGIADVALIRTNIDFTSFTDFVLSMADESPRTGDICYICGDPAGVDTDSVTKGTIRDAHYFEVDGFQIVDSLLVSASGIAGNSGSPILNKKGKIIGLFTFGLGDYETLGGGSNWDTLQSTMSVLATFQNNKSKKYLGLDFHLPTPFELYSTYGAIPSFDNVGVFVDAVSIESPFVGILEPGDILVSATLGATTYNFGSLTAQLTPGILCYEYSNPTIELYFYNISSSTYTNVLAIPFTKTYNDVPNEKDGPIQGGFNKEIEQTNKKLKFARVSKNIK